MSKIVPVLSLTKLPFVGTDPSAIIGLPEVLTGKRFTLDRSTLSIEMVGGKRTAVEIPAGTIIKVVSENGDGILDVLWDGRLASVFLVDVEARGTEIVEKTARV